jgi:hypothetical protein
VMQLQKAWLKTQILIINQENMSDMFPIGFKNLFDGYLTIEQFLNQLSLIIKHFLFDGYLIKMKN